MMDTRICIGANGTSSRAIWLHHSRHAGDLGLQTEFHRWDYRLSDQDVDSVRELLATVYRYFREFEPQLNGQDCADVLTFWGGKDRFRACLFRSPGTQQQYSEEQIAAFTDACNRIYELVPQPTKSVSD